MAELLTQRGVVPRRSTTGFGAELRPAESGWRLQVSLGAAPIFEIVPGLVWQGRDLVDGSELLGVTERRLIEDFDMLVGKAATHHTAEHLERRFELRHPEAGPWELLVRIADDGVALRYRVPREDGELGATGAGIALEPATRLWFQTYQTWYENPMRGAWAADLEEEHLGLPVLVDLGPLHVLVAESDVDGAGSGSHLRARRVDNSLNLDFEPADATLLVSAGSFTPWRVFITGSLADIVESDLVDELAPAAEAAAADWVKPGPAVWSWWSDHYSGSQPASQRRFVDFAAELGWRHILVDCGWVDDWVPSLVSYASRVGVGVHLWCRWNDLATPEQRRQLERWAAWGVAGLKVDFMESESNERYRWYEATIEEARRVGLMVNLHGSVIPRGWARRWPHVLSYEAVRANEYYSFYKEPIPTTHHVILPFTRNVLGSMDFTPAAFSTDVRDTSDGAEAAHLVLFECGLTHLADDPDAYRTRPSLMKLLRCLPDHWEQTILLDGHPDSHVVLARRSGETWFLAGMVSGAGRRIRVPLHRVGIVTRVWLLVDGAPGLVDRDIKLIDGELELELPADGGFVAVVGGLPTPAPTRSNSLPNVTQTELVLDADDSAILGVHPSIQLTPEPGWSATVEGEGRWLVRRTPDALTPSGVVSLRHPSGGVAHVRLHAHPVGDRWLSDLPFTSLVNHFGPVERDQSNGGGNPADGGPISIGGQQYAKGLGMSAPASAEFFLGRTAARFECLVGIDDEAPGTSAMVQVLVDGDHRIELVINGGEPPRRIELDVSGAAGLTLVALDLTGTNAHVDWAQALVRTKNVTEGTDAGSVDQEGKL